MSLTVPQQAPVPTRTEPLPAAPSPRGPVLDLTAHAGLPAVVLVDGTTWSHDELRARAAERAATWGPARRLVLVEGANTPEALVSYLAALNHGHVALVVPDGRPEQLAALRAAYDPDIVCVEDDHRVLRKASRHELHPELALLLSTSGSTGSPKLVRLSRRNVASNAASIADYLRLGPGDLAQTSLPLHYCYGLSVLHSHLHAGAGIVLTGLSVVDECFWELFTRVGATSFAGVPYTFDLLEHAGFADRHLPALRQVTQAGGRLAPERVRALAELGSARGWELFVMYGQTEATARMAWLPPQLAAEHPGSIGRAIPGGRLRVEPVPEASEPGVGELVYTGPNVMMGYAAGPDDLRRGPELSELRTGDLAREVDGLFEVVGRRNRYAKVFGLRLDLDRLERHLESAGLPARCVCEGDRVHAFVTDGRRSQELREAVAAYAGLPTAAVRVHLLPELPLTASGKVDQSALLHHARLAGDPAVLEPAASPEPGSESVGALTDRLVAQYALVLGRPTASPSDTFVGLGGDSLSYVELATRLEPLVPGGLPVGWHTRTIASLAERPPAPPARRPSEEDRGPAAVGRGLRSAWSAARLDTTIALRAVAIVLIVASHVDLVGLEGGAHLLLALAGYNFARFQLALPDRLDRLRHGLASLGQLVVPSVLWIGAVGLLLGSYGPSTALLVHQLFAGGGWTDQWQFWFLEALVWLVLCCLALVSVPALHRAERRHRFAFPLALLAVTAVLRYAVVGVRAGETERYTTWVVAFFFVLGWAGARAATRRQRLLVSGLALVLVPGFFGDPGREAIILAGFALMLWVPRLRCPAPLARAAGTLAGASLFVYLTQWQVYPPLEDAGHPVAALLATFAVGICYARLMRPVQRLVGARLRGLGARPEAPVVSVSQTPAEGSLAAR